ncbi:MAG: hypothetical protein ACRET3_01800 [Burkholderiales bacterium]
MKILHVLILALFAFASAAHAQSPRAGKDPVDQARERGEKAPSIEGFWQDKARRILFARNAPPAYVYGAWTLLDPLDMYSLAKQIRRIGGGFELIEFQFEEEDFPVRVIGASEDSIEFIRTIRWSPCAMHHKCRLNGQELFCSLENLCREEGRVVLDMRGEERYERRAHCERIARRQGQGIPLRCQ